MILTVKPAILCVSESFLPETSRVSFGESFVMKLMLRGFSSWKVVASLSSFLGRTEPHSAHGNCGAMFVQTTLLLYLQRWRLLFVAILLFVKKSTILWWMAIFVHFRGNLLGPPEVVIWDLSGFRGL